MRLAAWTCTLQRRRLAVCVAPLASAAMERHSESNEGLGVYCACPQQLRCVRLADGRLGAAGAHGGRARVAHGRTGADGCADGGVLRVHAARTCSLVCAACCMLHRTLHSFTAQAHRAKVAIEREERERLRSSDAAAWERSVRPTGPVPHRRSTDEAEQPAALAAAAAKRPRLMPPADGSAYARRIPIRTVPSSWRG